MTARYDMDIVNVTLYWHFTAATVAITLGLAPDKIQLLR